jgi:lactoylglutathione lyase
MGRDQNTPAWVQHLAMEVGSMEELLAAKERLVAAGIDVIGPVNHTIFKSIYFFDPNGHRLELACNTGTPEMMRSWTTSSGRCWKNGRRLRRRRARCMDARR